MIHLGKSKAIQEVLNAFLALFTQPLEQDLRASTRAAVVAISLAGLEGMALWGADSGASALEFGGSALVIVLIWMTVTAVFSKAECRMLALARNLSVLSFWIAATLAFVLAVVVLFPNPMDGDIRIWTCGALLLVLVPVHLTRSGYGPTSVWMTLALWPSTGVLVYKAIY